MATTLSLLQYLGGDDNLQVEATFPSDQKTVVYNFGQNISGWSFSMDYQTLVADTVAYDRLTGSPNFANSNIIGYFPKGNVNTSSYISVLSTASGTVSVTLPGGLYNEGILPNARVKVPITIIGFTWTDARSPSQTETHRWALVQTYEPGVNPIDPTTSTNYTLLGV